MKKPKAPKKFKDGTVELWYCRLTDELRYVVDATGSGEWRCRSFRSWFNNSAARVVLLHYPYYEYLGRF